LNLADFDRDSFYSRSLRDRLGGCGNETNDNGLTSGAGNSNFLETNVTFGEMAIERGSRLRLFHEILSDIEEELMIGYLLRALQ
jgi:hypothetical protein